MRCQLVLRRQKVETGNACTGNMPSMYSIHRMRDSSSMRYALHRLRFGRISLKKKGVFHALDHICNAADSVVVGLGEFLHAGWLYPPPAGSGCDYPRSQL